MSLPTFALLSAVVLLGTVFQVSIGFGLGLLAAPVIALAAPSSSLSCCSSPPGSRPRYCCWTART